MPSLKARLILTNECKGNCWYCNARRKDNDIMSLEQLKEIVDFLDYQSKIWNYSTIKVALTGGDPFNYPFFVQAMGLLKHTLGKKLSVIFGASICLSSDIGRVETLSNLGGKSLISLNEDEIEDIENKIIQVHKFTKIFALQVVLTEYNISRLEKIVNLGKKYNIPIRFNHLYQSRDKKGLRDSCEKIFELVGNDYKHYNYMFGCFNVDKQKKTYCGYGESFYLFHTNGDVSRCYNEFPIGKVSDPDIEQKIKINRDLSKCINCSVEPYCNGGCEQVKQFFCEEYKYIIEKMIEIRDNVKSKNKI